jgi:phosphatidylinositol glycan class U
VGLFYYIGETLLNSVEISGPTTSFLRLKEAITYKQFGLSPYYGDSIHENPLLIFIAELLKEYNFGLFLLYLLSDIVTSLFLYRSAALFFKSSRLLESFYYESIQEDYKHILAKLSSPSKASRAWLSERLELYALIQVSSSTDVLSFVLFCYLFNPYIILSTVARSSVVFINTSLMMAFYFALAGEFLFTTLSVALATWFNLYSIILLVPATLLLLSPKIHQNTEPPFKFLSNLPNFLLVGAFFFLMDLSFNVRFVRP